MKKINYYLILAICFLLPSYLVRFSIFGVPTTLLEILIYVSTFVTIILNIINNDSSTPFEITKKISWKTWLPIVLFLIAGTIGVVISPDKRVALGQFKGFILDPILFFWVIITNLKTEKQFKNILWAFIFSGIYVSIFAIYQKLTGELTTDSRIIGLFGYSPNYLAFYITPLALLTLFVPTLDTKSIFQKSMKMLLVLIFIYVIYLTASRAGLIAFFGGAFGALAIKNIINLKTSSAIKAIVIIALIVLAGFVGYKYLKPDFSLSPSDGGRITSSNNVRFQIWETTITKIVPIDNNWILGIGLGNYQPYFTTLTSDWVNYPEWISPWALTAHNLFLHTLLNVGILGLIAFVWLLVIFFRNIKFDSGTSYAVFAAMLAIMVQGLIDTPYWKNDLSVMFFIFLATVIIIKNNYEKSK